MRDQWSRRGFFGVAGAAALLTAATSAACSSQKDDDSARGGPVTIAHVFGETTVPEPPKRVVSAGYTGQDDLLAVGVVPIAVTNWFGDQPWAVWPWAQPRLGDAKPVVLDLNNGIPVKQIAEWTPTPISSCRRSRLPCRNRTAMHSSNRGRSRPPRSAGRCIKPVR